MQHNNEVRIIMIEDDPGHAGLIRNNLEDVGITNEIIHYDNGKDALDAILSNKDNIEDSNIVILLDLNLPGMDGYQILENLRKNEKTKIIPVCILTSTDNENEIKKCYELGCNAYVTKPLEYTEFQEAMRKLGILFTLVKIPKL